MDTGSERENGRHKTDHYKHAHMEWMGSSQDMKIMSLIAERDHALQEMNIAFAEKKAALAERDMFFLQRDSALSDRNSAILERDKALSSLHRLQQQQNQYFHPELCFNNESFNHNNTSSPKTKRSKKQPPKEPKKKQQVTIATRERQLSTRTRNQEWKEEELGLNEVNFDESTMAVPVCSCTGKYHQCYKWGEGGWQSSCCTLSVSMHPLPVMPNKRHARMSGRKMSGSVFKRLLSRLASEGFDLSVPLDLKDHWSRHGTNRYITIK